MSELILGTLRKKLDDLAKYGEIDAETRRNTLKEELQFYALNFIYHHPEYSKWTMYGGSALRICHGLDRMSVDLDFEISHAVSEEFLNELKKEIESHFFSTYGTDPNFLVAKTVSGRGLILKFNVGEKLSFGHPSKQIHIKIDIEHFIAPKVVTERIPINRGRFSFVISTYNMSALMASKIAAILLRGTRGVGKIFYEEKGRDIYDLLWYMNQRIVPDLNYLAAKIEDVKDLRMLFDRITLKMNSVSDENLKGDLLPLFTDRPYIENWLKNWRESYFRLLDAYRIRTVTTLESIGVHQDFFTDNFSFVYRYKTEEGASIRVVYTISDYWIDFRDGDLSIEIDKEVSAKMEFRSDNILSSKPQPKIEQYATLFYRKTEDYFERTNRSMFGDGIVTKFIRMTTDNLNQKEQIVLNKSALLSCKLDDLLK